MICRIQEQFRNCAKTPDQAPAPAAKPAKRSQYPTDYAQDQSGPGLGRIRNRLYKTVRAGFRSRVQYARAEPEPPTKVEVAGKGLRQHPAGAEQQKPSVPHPAPLAVPPTAPEQTQQDPRRMEHIVKALAIHCGVVKPHPQRTAGNGRKQHKTVRKFQQVFHVWFLHWEISVSTPANTG